MPSMTEAERRDALNLIETANREMAERAKAPSWYHAALGLLVGGLVAVQELPLPWPIAYYAIYGVGLVLLIRGYRRHTGMWVPGYRAGRTRWVAVGGALVVGAIFLGAVWLSRSTGRHGVEAAAGVVVAILVTASGYLWERAYRRDLGVG